MAGDFDSLTDKSAPGDLVPDEAIWDAVKEIGGGRTPSPPVVIETPGAMMTVADCAGWDGMVTVIGLSGFCPGVPDFDQAAWEAAMSNKVEAFHRLPDAERARLTELSGAHLQSAAEQIGAMSAERASRLKHPGCGPVRLLEPGTREMPAQLSSISHTFLPDGRRLDEVLEEHARLDVRIEVLRTALDAIEDLADDALG